MDDLRFKKNTNLSPLTPTISHAQHLPQAGDKAVSNQGNVIRPSGILREYPLFCSDAVEQGCPPRRHQQGCADIPFLEIVPDVRNDISKIHRVANETVWASRGKAPQGWPNTKKSSQAYEAGEAQKRRECYKHQPTRGPRRVAGHPPKIQHLGIRVGICNDDGGVRRQREILYLRWAPRESDQENEEVLHYVDPIYGGEGGRQVKKEGQLSCRDAEQEKVAEPSPGYSRDVRPHFTHLISIPFRQIPSCTPDYFNRES